MEKILNTLMCVTVVVLAITMYIAIPTLTVYVVVGVLVGGGALVLTYVVGWVCLAICTLLVGRG